MRELSLVICWLGVLQSVLLSLYFISSSKENYKKLFLAIVLLMIAIRAAKSTLYVFSTFQPIYILNIGFAAHAALAPALYFFVRSLKEGFTFKQRHILQFIPATLLLALCTTLTLEGFWYTGGYTVLLFYTLIYLVLTWKYFSSESRQSLLPEQVKWIGLLLIAFSVFLLSYFTNYVMGWTSYLSGPLLYSILIYGIGFIVLKYNRLFSFEVKRKYQNVNLPKEEMEMYTARIQRAYAEQRIFLNPDFSLSALSKSVNIPVHILSYLFSEHLKKSFIQLTNQYRIEEAKKLLVDPAKKHLSISGIAYEAGFNSLTSFNTAFKKIVKVTPSEFQKMR